jgi:hypothetical protein
MDGYRFVGTHMGSGGCGMRGGRGDEAMTSHAVARGLTEGDNAWTGGRLYWRVGTAALEWQCRVGVGNSGMDGWMAREESSMVNWRGISGGERRWEKSERKVRQGPMGNDGVAGVA